MKFMSSVKKTEKNADIIQLQLVLPEAKIVQKMPDCGSIDPNFRNLLNNIGWSDNIDC